MYMWFFPEFEISKMEVWSTSAQASDGHINEWLSQGPGSEIDVAGGRVMGDTTTLYIIELFEIYRETGAVLVWPELF